MCLYLITGSLSEGLYIYLYICIEFHRECWSFVLTSGQLPVSSRSTPELYYMFTVYHKTPLSPGNREKLCIKAATLQYQGRVVWSVEQAVA